jgi:hypothetical protein
VFHSLTKDMTGKEDVYRGPAIRALCRITDVRGAQRLWGGPGVRRAKHPTISTHVFYRRSS